MTSPEMPSGSRLVAMIVRSGAPLKQILCQLRTGLHQVLAVVQYEQRMATLQRFDQGLQQRSAPLLGHTKRCSYRLRYERRVR